MKRAFIVSILLLSALIPASRARGQNTSANLGGNPGRNDLWPPLGVQFPQWAPSQALSPSSLPTWTGSFSFQGNNYPYTMVGTNPASGSHTTHVAAYIVPLELTFPDQTTLSPNQPSCVDALGRSPLQLTENSPIYQSFGFKPGGTNVGTTQYADAFQRANFWRTVSRTSPNYHVSLTLNTVPTQVFLVPGATDPPPSGACQPIGYIDIGWFTNNILIPLSSGGNSACTAGPPNPAPFPCCTGPGTGTCGDNLPAIQQSNNVAVFLTYNVFLTSAPPFPDIIYGFHDSFTNTKGTLLTTIEGAFTDPNVGPGPDIQILTHEVGEWMDDPFGNNQVPSWGHVGQVDGCLTVLEVGDPVTGVGFSATGSSFTYHPEDLVFLPWFAHQTPSTSVNGWFDFLNTFSSPPPIC